MKTLLAVLLLAALSVGAQTANVIEMFPIDAARVQKSWEALQKAQAEWDATRKEIGEKYQVSLTSDKRCTDGTFKLACPIWLQPGFENGFEFSKDFKFIVPKRSIQYGGATACCGDLQSHPFPYVTYPADGGVR